MGLADIVHFLNMMTLLLFERKRCRGEYFFPRTINMNWKNIGWSVAVYLVVLQSIYKGNVTNTVAVGSGNPLGKAHLKALRATKESELL